MQPSVQLEHSRSTVLNDWQLSLLVLVILLLLSICNAVPAIHDTPVTVQSHCTVSHLY